MEIRKVIIVTSGGQSKRVVETGAETLGQLKEDLRAANIDYAGKTFFEGLSKTELTHDDSLLPKDIMRNGVPTNNLVFMLTTPQKKIRSGAMDRKEAYARIKELGLQDACIREFGKNFTMCKTNELIALIEEATKTPEEEVTERVAIVESNKEKITTSTAVENAIRELVDVLYNNDCIDSEEADKILGILPNRDSYPKNSPYTEAELDDMIKEYFN